jgi:hypothetical protein
VQRGWLAVRHGGLGVVASTVATRYCRQVHPAVVRWVQQSMLGLSYEEFA